ncbi:ABC transporter permease [Endozoicomonas montiporae]|uniref:Putative thiamine transport system permease protein n=2 Tax=Endozoicomonas montiporae TaxID=1027273 RepID=A0A142BI08_9GAMM|nr:hypothetical protein [Endozoicomonas montiporae]AMO58384.1 putative thiamine transport system permease protein [Endozoicomonas montiporae CL-33]
MMSGHNPSFFSVQSFLRPGTVVVVLLCLVPLFAGVAGLILPALGYYPALGFDAFSTTALLNVWEPLFQWPGLSQSIWLSLFTGLTSAFLALVITLTVLSLLWGGRFWNWVTLYIAPALALPHVAFAIGLSFLIAPSGWLVRAIAPLTGWHEPPFWLTVNDPKGWSLILMLLIKSVPFLLLMSVGILHQLQPQRQLMMAQSLGYDRIQAWWKVLVPQLYRQLKLPLFAVLVYGITVVDAALVIGPQLPAPLAVLVLRWFQNPDLSFRLLASAGAIVLLIVTLAGLLFWFAVERLLAPLARMVWLNGRKQVRHPVLWLAFSTLPVLALLSIGANLVLLIWSFAGRWRFPDILPSVTTIQYWQHHASLLQEPLLLAMQLGLASSLTAVVASLVMLEYQNQRGRYWPLLLPCIALLIPQMTLFAGLPMVGELLFGAGVDQYPFLLVSFGHLLMVFPYVYLGLHGAFTSFDHRYQTVALTFGSSWSRAWWQVKWPMLKPAIVSAWAVGFSVSVVQYLPTLLLGAGRVLTVTTEAVAIGAGYDRRLAAIYGLTQALLPLLGFLFARFINRKKAWQG